MWRNPFSASRKLLLTTALTPNNSSPPSLEPGQSTAGVLAQHHGVGLITAEVGAGKSTAARRSSRYSSIPTIQDPLRALLLGVALRPARQIGLELLEPRIFAATWCARLQAPSCA